MVDPKAAWSGEWEQDRLVNATTQKMFIEIGRAVRNLQEFRTFLETNTTRELFTSADNLASKVTTILHDWLLEQAVIAARATYSTEEAKPLPTLPSSKVDGGVLEDYSNFYWKEQVHLFSANQLVKDAAGVRIALIACRANLHHPALSGTSIKLFDARPYAG